MVIRLNGLRRSGEELFVGGRFSESLAEQFKVTHQLPSKQAIGQVTIGRTGFRHQYASERIDERFSP